MRLLFSKAPVSLALLGFRWLVSFLGTTPFCSGAGCLLLLWVGCTSFRFEPPLVSSKSICMRNSIWYLAAQSRYFCVSVCGGFQECREDVQVDDFVSFEVQQVCFQCTRTPTLFPSGIAAMSASWFPVSPIFLGCLLLLRLAFGWHSLRFGSLGRRQCRQG